MRYSAEEIAGITKGKIIGPPDVEILRVSIDSRTIYQTGGLLFIAISGERHDGHRYIPGLIERGVRAFLVQDLPEGKAGREACFIVVKDSLRALQDLAAHHRGKSRAEVIGITGSNGKTIVKEWIHQSLSGDRQVVRSPKSYNSQVGVPLSVLLLEENTETAILEAGISRTGEMENLERIICPDIGILTNIGEAHQEGFRDMEEKIREKIRLFRNCKKLVYCRDQPEVDRILREEFKPERLFAWSLDPGSDMQVIPLKKKGAGSGFRIRCRGEEVELGLPFEDRASVENAMQVAALLLLLEYPPQQIRAKMAGLSPVAMRMEIIQGINNCTLINDTYNSDPVSLSIALDSLHQQNRHARKTLILSDILQSGRRPEDLYTEVSELLKKKNIERFIGIGPRLLSQRSLFPPAAVFFPSTSDFLASVASMQFRNEAILIKGARPFSFEKITHHLQEKNHRTVLEIDLSALVHNLNVYRSMTRAKIMVMVKAFAYGGGSLEIASVLQYQKVDYLCVAYVDEGISLREAGIHLPILVMNPEVSGFDLMIDHDLEPEIYNFRSLFSFISALEKRNLPSFPIHLKLETGMNRLGFREEELEKLFGVLEKQRGLEIRSVFSHLGASDESRWDDYSREQIRKFERMSRKIQERFPGEILRHILNSAGIERFPEDCFDMVRLGIGLYGIGHEKHLLPVTELKSIISQVKSVNKGESVGYGRNYIADRDLIIGIVPIGYADGLRRDLGQKGISFLVRGIDAPVLGTLCMDMCMIDLSGVGAEEGDEVLVFGREKPVTELAEKLGTIPYEVLAGLSERVKRVYFQE